MDKEVEERRAERNIMVLGAVAQKRDRREKGREREKWEQEEGEEGREREQEKSERKSTPGENDVVFFLV